jgi:hypothetical protein
LIKKESDAADMRFIIEKLELFQSMFSLEYINKETDHSWSFHKEISSFLEANIPDVKQKHPAVYFNYMVLKLALNPHDIRLYKNIKDFLMQSLNNISAVKLSRYTFDLINYCYLMVNEGKAEYRNEMQSLLEFLDEKSLVAPGGNINHSYFKIALENSITLRKLEWLEDFIDKYSQFIEPGYKENLTNLAYAKLYFFKGDYAKARHYQSYVAYTDFIHYIDAKLILACIEYNEYNYSSINLIFDTIKKYIARYKNITSYYRFFYKTFMVFLSRLVKIKEASEAGKDAGFEIKALESAIKNEARSFYGKRWLLERISALKAAGGA